MISMSKKLRKLKNDALSKYQTISWPPFDMQEPKTQYVYRNETQQKIIYISNMNDQFVRSVAGHIMEKELGTPYSNEQISEWLKRHDLVSEVDLYQFVIEYGQNGSDEND